MDHSHLLLSNQVPPPQAVLMHGGYAYRFLERTLAQAIIQKLARLITGLRATHLLMVEGFTQEQAAMQRIVQEIDEDVLFLAFGQILGNRTALHDDYLKAFYEEEFDESTALASTQRRPMTSRKKIRAYLAKVEISDQDVALASRVARTIHYTYSGFLHAASPQVMELVQGRPPRWQLRGSKSSPLYEDHKNDIWNYFYRSLASFAIAAKAIGDDALSKNLVLFAVQFAQKADCDP